MPNLDDKVSSTSSTTLSPLQVSLAGFLSGTATRCLIQPLDVLKIRFQLMPTVPNQLPKYRGIFHAVITIAKQEGITAFWKGHVPAQILSAFYSAVSFTIFEYMKKRSSENSSLSTTAINFVSGGVAGTVATAGVYPIDFVRTRLVAQGEPKLYANMRHAFVSICQNGGFVKFFPGLGPALLMIFPSSAVSFAVYHSLRPIVVNQQFYGHTSFLFGCIAGICGKMCVLPLDLAKKRLQVSNFTGIGRSLGVEYQYKGLIDCFMSVLRKEGLAALFKGTSPTIIKAGCYSGLLFWTYELFSSIIKQLGH